MPNLFADDTFFYSVDKDHFIDDLDKLNEYFRLNAQKEMNLKYNS